MQTWEYKVLEARHPSSQKADVMAQSLRDYNLLGQQGWEAVGVSGSSDSNILVLFKRWLS